MGEQETGEYECPLLLPLEDKLWESKVSKALSSPPVSAALSHSALAGGYRAMKFHLTLPMAPGQGREKCICPWYQPTLCSVCVFIKKLYVRLRQEADGPPPPRAKLLEIHSRLTEMPRGG